MLNLLLVALQHDSSFDFVFHSDLSSEARQSLLAKLQKISRRGLLADWGYAVPFYPSDAAKPPSLVGATAPAVHHQPTDAAASSPLTSLTALDETPTSPVAIPDDLDENIVPVRNFGAGDANNVVEYVALSELKETDDIILSMGGAPPLDPCWPSVDTNPLYRTVSTLFRCPNKCQSNLISRVPGLGWQWS